MMVIARSKEAQTRRELDAVYEVSKTLSASLDVGKTFREALNYLLHAFDWRRAFVVLGEAGGPLRGLCAAGLSQEEQQRLLFRVGEGIVGRVFASGVPAIDEAIRRIVHSQEHYQAFSPGLARDFDVIEIRRTWYFDVAIRLY